MASVVNSNLTVPSAPVAIKKAADSKSVSATVNASISKYKNLPGPRGEAGTKGC